MTQRKIPFSGLVVISTCILLAQWQCGQKSDSTDPIGDSTYIPDDWNGQDDWPDSSFTISDLP
ncbi:hypothetical protein [Pseudobacteriovorax antillogorgiicola]|uniref:Uncharacterized protein n=1 Tax=Pseudobacteriovorax antillogorgiicola TaxID=1513793 RepID=A0A1Y6CNA2_9BACT|nr:hypothetical protein [Pseudobacteriovorax antillogorgiicola]TCS45029.1 hypothetical protein EDD56_13066 [Pseudobacteriovorax antillogorgiicola]SMF76201.1 hypothetical protein SAMN06296036_1308 [Pseudobacteriovorax antillogorgiicola]